MSLVAAFYTLKLGQKVLKHCKDGPFKEQQAISTIEACFLEHYSYKLVNVVSSLLIDRFFGYRFGLFLCLWLYWSKTIVLELRVVLIFLARRTIIQKLATFKLKIKILLGLF